MKSVLDKDGLRTYEGHHYEIVEESNYSQLREKVKSMMREDVRSALMIKRMLKTTQTFENSLGYLYEFLNDKMQCFHCTKRIQECPKKEGKGYTCSLQYDEATDCIKTIKQVCDIHLGIQTVLANINPCDCSTRLLYDDATSLVNCLTTGQNLIKMKDVAYLITNVHRDAKNRTLEKGFAITAPLENPLVDSTLHAIAMYYAKNGKKVAYIQSKSFFSNLFSFNKEIQEITERDYILVKKADVVIFENLDNAGYLSKENAEKYLKPLIESRQRSNRITFCSYSSKHKWNRWFYSKDFGEIEEYNSQLSSLFESKVIKDLDLR